MPGGARNGVDDYRFGQFRGLLLCPAPFTVQSGAGTELLPVVGDVGRPDVPVYGIYRAVSKPVAISDGHTEPVAVT